MVIDNPAVPLAFTKNQKGMQGGEALTGEQEAAAVSAWLEARDRAVEMANKLADLEVHKQYANRILEPWAHITVVCSATDWDNFFALRCHEMAQPEIHALADLIYEKYINSTPQQLDHGQWHAPFTNSPGGMLGLCEQIEMDAEPQLRLKKSVARCARVSYLNHEGKNPITEEDLLLYERLLGSAPLHASPAEHQAMAIGDPNVRSGNFRGWVQFRKTLKNENVEKFKID